MALIQRRIPHFQKPEGPVEIDWGNRLTDGLVGVILHRADGGHELVTNKRLDLVSNPQYAVNDKGRGLRTDPATGYIDATSVLLSSLNVSAGAYITLFEYKAVTGINIPDIIGAGITTSETDFIAIRETVAPSLIARYRASSTNFDVVLDTSPSSLINVPIWIGMSWDANNVYGYINRSDKGSTTRTATASGLNVLKIGRKNQGTSTSNDNVNGIHNVSLIYNRHIPFSEYLSLTENPYQIIKPRRRFYVIQGGGEATVSADITGNAQLSAITQKNVDRTSSISGVSDLVSADQKTANVAANIADTADISASVTAQESVSTTANITVTSALSAETQSNRNEAADITDISALNAQSQKNADIAGNITGISALTASEQTNRNESADISGAAGISAATSAAEGTSTTANITEIATLSASVQADRQLSASLSGTSSLSGDEQTARSATGDITGTSALNATASTAEAASATANITGTSAVSAQLESLRQLTAALNGNGSISAAVSNSSVSIDTEFRTTLSIPAETTALVLE